MSKYYLMTFEDLKLFLKSGMGMFTFAAYHQFLFDKVIKYNDEKNEIKNKQNIKELEEKHKIEMNNLKNELQTQIQQIQSRRWFKWI